MKSVVSFLDRLSEFRAPKIPMPKKQMPGFRGRREEARVQLQANAGYVIRQPKLCEQMPHRYYPVRAEDELCIRCGMLKTEMRS